MGTRINIDGGVQQAAFGDSAHLVLHNHAATTESTELTEAVRRLAEAITKLPPDVREQVARDGHDLVTDLSDPGSRKSSVDMLTRLKDRLAAISATADVIAVITAIDQLVRLLTR